VACTCSFILLGRLFPHRLDLVLVTVILFSVPFCFLSGWSLTMQRRLNSRLLPKADLYAEQVQTSGLRRIFLLALGGSFLRGVVVTVLGIACILFLLKPLIDLLNFVPEIQVRSTELPIWGLGLGTMIYLFWKKANFRWSVCGMLLGIILLLI